MNRILLIVIVSTAFCEYGETHKESDPYESDLNFYFYSIINPSQGIQTNISNPIEVTKTAFSSNKDTFFCIHGWQDSANSTSCLSIKNAILQKYDTNIFIVDWDKIAEEPYIIAVFKIEYLGKVLGKLIRNFVYSSGLNLDKTSIVAHSLGAHLAGVAGTSLNGELQQIIGLDPAGLGFSLENTNNRLSTSSAKFVHVIHTARIMGYSKQIGHADYYPNGGECQPMCNFFDLNCSHLVVLKYYVESLLTGKFKANHCRNYNEYKKGVCNNTGLSLMGGYYVDKNANGNYYLDTNTSPPYAKNYC